MMLPPARFWPTWKAASNPSNSNTAEGRPMHFLALVFTLLFGVAHAQDFPSKPIRWIVPFPPGGGADATARIISQKMTELTGKQVVVDYRAGAGGNIGTEFVARAPADGYTILQTTNGHTIQPHLRKLS